MRVKTRNGKLNVTVMGNMASSFLREFEKELRYMGDKYDNIADVSIDCTGKMHYKLYVTAKNGAKRMFIFSTTNTNTIRIYMRIVTTFLKSNS